MGEIDIYNKMKTPPADALKKIDAGTLKGKTNIDPQWRIQVMTETFGLCGVGWKFNVLDTKVEQCPEGQRLVYMQISLQVKSPEGEWSEPIYAWGGDVIVDKNKNGLVPNDEAYKMCLTDALGGAMRYLGVAADVYQGKFDNKYERQAWNNTPNSTQGKSNGANTNNVPFQNNQTVTAPFTTHTDGKLMVKHIKNGSWMVVSTFNKEQMKWAWKCEKYKEVQSEIESLALAKFGAEWQN